MAAGAGRAAARRAVLQLGVARLASLLLMFVGITVLARLLDPADFGTFALAMAICAVARTVAEAGFLQDAIRRPSPMPAGTLALAALLSFGLAVAMAALLIGMEAWLPAGLLPGPLREALVPIALVLPVGGLILQREARLHREVAFDAPARAGVVGVAGEVCTGIALAWAGLGVMALAWGHAAGVVLRAGALMLLSEGLRPVRPKLGEAAALAGFGLRMTAVSLLPKLADLALVTALSGIAGAAVTGLFNRAQRVCQILDDVVFEGLRPLMLPVISAALRDGMSPDRVVAAKHDYLMPIALAGFGGTALLAGPLVAALLGPGWEAAVDPVRILALAGLAMPVNKMALKLFTAMGRLDDYARIQNLHLLLRVALGVAGAALSLEAVCLAILASSYLKAGLILRWERRHAGAPLRLFARCAARGAGVTAATLAGPLLLLWTTALPAPLLLAGALGLAVPVWLLCLRLLGHPLAGEIGATLRGAPLLRRLEGLR
jgi:O-antigen/teichoic acid export membrane protein